MLVVTIYAYILNEGGSNVKLWISATAKPYLKDAYMCLSRSLVNILAYNSGNVLNNDKEMKKWHTVSTVSQKHGYGAKRSKIGTLLLSMRRRDRKDGLEARKPMSDERMR